MRRYVAAVTDDPTNTTTAAGVANGHAARSAVDHGRSKVDDRTAVLIGVGVASHGVGIDGHVMEDPEPLDVMVAAAQAALRDACDGGSWGAERSTARSALQQVLDAIGMVAVPEGNWTYPDPARLVADRLGARSARTVRVDIGVPQCTPVRVAVERIEAGELEAALVVGGEAKATQLRITRAGGTPVETSQEGVEPDECWAPTGELMAEPEISAGIWDPVAQYACIENARRVAEGRSLDGHLDDIAELWAAFNRVANANLDAVFGDARDAAFLRTAGPGNRPLAFPYAKWHSTQWAVDQGGALLLCSARLAREAGVPPDRWVFPHVLVESSTSVSLTKRGDLHRWPAMEVLGRVAAEHVGRPLASVEHVEVYSCFPAAVRVQQRELGLPEDAAPTLVGGMAFAGGPFNNFTYQATHAVIRAVRDDPGSLGMVTTVSGLLTKPGLAVWSTEPPATGVCCADLGEDAAHATATVDVVGEADGLGEVATYTVTYAGDEPSSAFVIADLSDGRRWIGTSEDPALLAAGVGAGAGELIGRSVQVEGRSCTLA